VDENRVIVDWKSGVIDWNSLVRICDFATSEKTCTCGGDFLRVVELLDEFQEGLAAG
jgi:hypothetical protein